MMMMVHKDMMRIPSPRRRPDNPRALVLVEGK